MTKPGGDRGDWHAAGEQMACNRVAHVVQPDPPQAGPLHLRVEALPDLRRPDRGAVRVNAMTPYELHAGLFGEESLGKAKEAEPVDRADRRQRVQRQLRAIDDEQ